MKHIFCFALVFILVFGVCGCSKNQNIADAPKEDVLAFVEVNGEKIKNFDPKTQKYDVPISNKTFVKAELYAENTGGNSENVKYKYPDTVEVVYMVKYNGTI